MNNNEKNKEALNDGNWIYDQRLSAVPKSKLEFLQLVLFESKSLKSDEMLPFILSIYKISNEKNISFTESDMELIMKVLEDYAEPKDIAKLHQLMSMRKA